MICLLCIFEVSAQNEEPGAFPAYQTGNPDAKYKIEVFVDFQCPTCAVFGQKLNALKAKYPNDISIVFRNFPLAIPAHDKARAAAKAAEAAGQQGKFWEMYDLLLRHQKRWSRSNSADVIFNAYAKKLGLDVEAFKRDLESEEVVVRIDRDIQRGRSLNINATPTVLLNGNKLTFEEALDLEAIILKDK
ncbi:MAG: thioredoxin domain-containing protein [Acidobacteria bacterium]|nr:thioredoxin domain-containing protein [Acidobacteriota bacterium]